jgi:hypothetical protein
VAAQRLRAQLLSGAPARTVAGVTGHLLAIQAQDPRGARLAVRARTSGLTAADVDEALTADRSAVISWLNRGTLHLVLAEDYWWLHQLTTPQLATGNARRLAQEGVPPADAERAAGVIERSLAADGPLTRAELRERVAAAGVRTEGQAMVHLLALATLRGLTVRGPMRGGEQAFVLVRDWLGAPPPPMDREQALALLARRYLAVTPRPTAGTWPSGPACRCATRAGGWPRSPPGSPTVMTGWPAWPPGRASPGRRKSQRCRACACWVPSTRCCSAGPPARCSWRRAARSSPPTGCSARSCSSGAGAPRSGPSPAARW